MSATATRAAADRDYDAPRVTSEPPTDSLEMLQETRATPQDDLGEPDFTDGFVLPSTDLLDEDEMSMPVIPVQPGEFRCASCFLVLHQHMAASRRETGEICRDCA